MEINRSMYEGVIMKKKNHKVPVLAKVLFPETYEDAENALLRYMPFLKMPEMRHLLAIKASFLTTLAIGMSNEREWDLKEERGEDVKMCIFLSKETLPASEMEADEEVRRCANYAYVSKMVSGYVNAFRLPTKKLPHNK